MISQVSPMMYTPLRFPWQAAAVADYTRNPLLFQSDLGELSAVRQLAGDAAHAPAYKLMTAMLGGDLAAYRAAATPAALQVRVRVGGGVLGRSVAEKCSELCVTTYAAFH
eukprot:72603-Chlamydomonas_euryale.AAC.2